MDYVLKPQHWKKYFFHRGHKWNFLSFLGNGFIPGGREKDKARQEVFLTQTNPSGNDPEEERAHNDLTVPQKALYITKCSILGTIVKSAGSRIGILAHAVVCNHDLCNDT